MLLFPFRQQIWPLAEAAHDAVYIFLGDGLQDDAAELVLQKFDLRACFNPVLAAQFGGNYKLALGCECST